MAACNEANYRYFHEWQDLSAEQQATIVAHYLLNRLMQNHLQDAENRYIKQQQRRK